MSGPSTTDENLRGVIPNSFLHIFQFVKSTKDIEFLIRCTYLELYNEEIRDLLAAPKSNVKCDIREDTVKGVYVTGLTDVVVESPEDLNRMFDKGLANRSVASTLMNAESSRSHSIFTIVVEMSTKDAATGKDMLRVGKLNLVDLAGSERAKKTGATDKTLKEGIKINLSLSVLGNVIAALSEGGKHIPYRESKLTRLLQDSLGGNTKTMMVAAISPADYNFEETLSTLKYANRAKNIKNKPKINEDPKDTMIREFKAEIERLRKLLSDQATAATIVAQLSGPIMAQPPSHSNENPPSPNQNRSLIQSQPSQSAPSSAPSSAPTSSVTPQVPLQSIPQPEDDAKSDQVSKPEATPRSPSPRAKQSAKVTETYSNKETEPYAEEDEYEDQFEEVSPIKASPIPSINLEEYAQNNPDLDQKLRDEVANRLHQLEHMLVMNQENQDSATNNNIPDYSTNQSSKLSNSPPMKAKSQKEIDDETEELRIYQEKRVKDKKKKEEKRKEEMKKILDEKRAVEDELEELKSSLSTNPQRKDEPSNSANDSEIVKKMTKMKKRYEKKMTNLEEELEEVREDFYFQRKQLMDAMLEQEKDIKLYELICKALLSEKDFRKIIEKSRYDEDSDEWIIPVVKKRSAIDIDSTATISGQATSSSISTTSRQTNNSLLPDINSKVNINSKDYLASNNTTSNSNSEKAMFSQTLRVESQNKANKNNPMVPLLTLPGSLISASSLLHQDEDAGPPSSHRNGLLPGIGNHNNSGYQMKQDSEEKEKKKKSKPKIPKPPAPKVDNNNITYMDEMGSGENAGPIDDWGFAIAPSNNNEPENEYGSDEDFVQANTKEGGKKKKNRANRNSRSNDNDIPSSNSSSMLPPIHSTPRGNFLPPI